MAALFGAELHVTGTDTDQIERSLAPLRQEAGIRIERVEPTLEDVFVHTMNHETDDDNSSPGRAGPPS
jgi:ABC-2 type transport system ATP-binding protein